MIKLLLEPVNFLILDEPTNHLDMRTKDVLKEAIRAFDGTVIVVSHDRDFLDGLVTKVYEFGGGVVREHIGGIYDFLQKKEMESLDELHTAGSPSATTTTSPTPAVSSANAATMSEGKLSYEERKEQAKIRRKLEREVERCEAEVTRLETEKSALEARLATPEGAADTTLFTQYSQLQQALSAAETAWEEAMEALE